MTQKIVFDTNVIIDGLLRYLTIANHEYTCARIVLRDHHDKHIVQLGRSTAGELLFMFNFVYRRLIENEMIETDSKVFEAFAKLIQYAEFVKSDEVELPKEWEACLKDKSDIQFVQVAIASDADYIVTRDRKSGLFALNELRDEIKPKFIVVNSVELLGHIIADEHKHTH
jgi:predicted nucleic acid-binding protein